MAGGGIIPRWCRRSSCRSFPRTGWGALAASVAGEQAAGKAGAVRHVAGTTHGRGVGVGGVEVEVDAAESESEKFICESGVDRYLSS